MRYEIRRELLVFYSIWRFLGEGQHPTKGHFEVWRRVSGVFFRRKTAEGWMNWLEMEEKWRTSS